MNPVLDKILRNGNTTSASGEIIKVHSQISEKEGESLQEIISKVRPKVSLEIGLAYGIASLFMCEALAKVQAERHIIIDPFQHQGSELTGFPFQHGGWKGIGFINLKRAGYREMMTNFTRLRLFSYLPKLEADGVRIDFAFIDTDAIRSTTSWSISFTLIRCYGSVV